MSRFWNSDIVHDIQHLLYQPAVRRTAALTVPSKGFTIVELLIVIVVIGILAAIVIVAYNGIQNRGNDTAVQTDLDTLIKKLEISKSLNGKYPIPPTVATDIHITKRSYYDSNNLYYCYDSSADKYAVQARSISKNVYKIVDGVVSAGAATNSNGYSGQGTCDILAAGITWSGTTASLGYDTGTKTWATWAQ